MLEMQMTLVLNISLLTLEESEYSREEHRSVCRM